MDRGFTTYFAPCFEQLSLAITARESPRFVQKNGPACEKNTDTAVVPESESSTEPACKPSSVMRCAAVNEFTGGVCGPLSPTSRCTCHRRISHLGAGSGTGSTLVVRHLSGQRVSGMPRALMPARTVPIENRKHVLCWLVADVEFDAERVLIRFARVSGIVPALATRKCSISPRIERSAAHRPGTLRRRTPCVRLRG